MDLSSISSLFFGSKPKLDVQTRSTLTPEQEAMLKNVLGQLGGPGTDLNKGNFLSDAENTSLAGLEQMAMDRAGVQSDANAALDEVIKNKGNPNDFEDFYKTNVQDPAMRDYEQTVKPAISRSYGGSSFFSTDRAKADEKSSNDLITSLSAQRANLAYKSRDDAANRLMQAIGLQPQVASSQSQTAISELGAFGTERQAREQRISDILNALGVKGVENIGAGLPGQSGLVQEFVGGFAGGLGKAAGSDRRLKENIERVGATPGGIPVYRFRYIGEHEMRVGVMADEVKHIPDAVHTINGVDYVDYTKVH